MGTRAGILLGHIGEHKSGDYTFWTPGCTSDGAGTNFNPHFASDNTETWGYSFCKHKPNDLPDYEALKADLTKTTLYCLDIVPDFETYRICVTDIQRFES